MHFLAGEVAKHEMAVQIGVAEDSGRAPMFGGEHCLFKSSWFSSQTLVSDAANGISPAQLDYTLMSDLVLAAHGA